MIFGIIYTSQFKHYFKLIYPVKHKKTISIIEIAFLNIFSNKLSHHGTHHFRLFTNRF